MLEGCVLLETATELWLSLGADFTVRLPVVQQEPLRKCLLEGV